MQQHGECSPFPTAPPSFYYALRGTRDNTATDIGKKCAMRAVGVCVRERAAYAVHIYASLTSLIASFTIPSNAQRAPHIFIVTDSRSRRTGYARESTKLKPSRVCVCLCGWKSDEAWNQAKGSESNTPTESSSRNFHSKLNRAENL